MSTKFPLRIGGGARRADQELVRVLQEMTLGKEIITARAVARRMSSIRHASSLTRDAWRKASIDEAEERRLQTVETPHRSDGLQNGVRAPVQSIDLTAMRSFLKVARTGNIGRAAQELGITQTTLSKRIQKLEQQYGVGLLSRHGKGVALTDVGSALLDKVENILGFVDSPLPYTATADSPPKHACISLPCDVGGLMAPGIAQRVRASWPNVSLELREGDGLQVERWLRSNQVDLAVIRDPTPIADFTVRPLRTNALGIVAPPNSPLAEAISPLDLRDMTGLPLILPDETHPVRRQIAVAASQRGIQLESTLDLNSFALMIALVRSGHGYGIATQIAIRDHLARGSLVFRRLRRPALTSTYALVLGKSPSAVALELATAVSDTIKDLSSANIWPEADDLLS